MDAENPNITSFSIQLIGGWRRKCSEITAVNHKEDNKKWILSPCDPDEILEIFGALHLPEDLHLVGYISPKGMGGSGLVMLWQKGFPPWVPSELVNEGEEFYDVYELIKNQLQQLGWRGPDLSKKDIMTSIMGDDTPISYIEASIFNREIEEFGAFWHSLNWSTHEVIDNSVLLPGNYSAVHDIEGLPYSNPLTWEWVQEKPDDWNPRVIMEDDLRSVIFYTYSGLHQETIYFHKDTYKENNYQCVSEIYPIAYGPEGYVF